MLALRFDEFSDTKTTRQPGAATTRPLCTTGRRQCSVWSRSLAAGVLLLPGTKQSFGPGRTRSLECWLYGVQRTSGTLNPDGAARLTASPSPGLAVPTRNGRSNGIGCGNGVLPSTYKRFVNRGSFSRNWRPEGLLARADLRYARYYPISLRLRLPGVQAAVPQARTPWGEPSPN